MTIRTSPYDYIPLWIDNTPPMFHNAYIHGSGRYEHYMLNLKYTLGMWDVMITFLSPSPPDSLLYCANAIRITKILTKEQYTTFMLKRPHTHKS